MYDIELLMCKGVFCELNDIELLFTNIRPCCRPTAVDVVPRLVDLPHVDAVVGVIQTVRPVLPRPPVGEGPGDAVLPGPGPH